MHLKTYLKTIVASLMLCNTSHAIVYAKNSYISNFIVNKTDYVANAIDDENIFGSIKDRASKRVETLNSYFVPPAPINNLVKLELSGIKFNNFTQMYYYAKPAVMAKTPLHNDYYVIKRKRKNNMSRNTEIWPAIVIVPPSGLKTQDFLNYTSLPEYAYHNGYFLVVINSPTIKYSIFSEKIGKYTKNDVDTLKAVIKSLRNNHDVDTRRVYVFGIGDGGFLVSTLACSHGDDYVVAAGTALSSVYSSVNNICTNDGVPFININGGSDSVVDITGGKDKLGEYESAEEMFSTFASLNKCKKIGDFNVMQHNPSSPTESWSRVATECKDGTTNKIIGIRGGGHQLPNIFLNKDGFSGLTTYDFDLGREVFKYFDSIDEKRFPQEK